MRSASTTEPSERRVIANVMKGSIGNLIEWYDWYAYTAFSVYFAATFFPKGNPTAQLLNTAAVFAVGFLMRPLGGWLLGRFADQFGRRAALVLTVTMMAAGSLLIAVTPGYAFEVGARYWYSSGKLAKNLFDDPRSSNEPVKERGACQSIKNRSSLRRRGRSTSNFSPPPGRSLEARAQLLQAEA